MTDERIGELLWQAIDALPRGGGVVFRHYTADSTDRIELARHVVRKCREKGLLLAVARDVGLAQKLGAPLVHNPDRDAGGLPFSRSAHSLAEARAAWESGAAMIFLSPVFPTRSHPDAEPMSEIEARAIVAASPIPVIALGGMNSARFEEVKPIGFYGWAGIDAWLNAEREPKSIP